MPPERTGAGPVDAGASSKCGPPSRLLAVMPMTEWLHSHGLHLAVAAVGAATSTTMLTHDLSLSFQGSLLLFAFLSTISAMVVFVVPPHIRSSLRLLRCPPFMAVMSAYLSCLILYSATLQEPSVVATQARSYLTDHGLLSTSSYFLAGCVTSLSPASTRAERTTKALTLLLFALRGMQISSSDHTPVELLQLAT